MSRMDCQLTACWCHCWFFYWRIIGWQVWQNKDFSVRCNPPRGWSISMVCPLSIIFLLLDFGLHCVLWKLTLKFVINVSSATAQSVQTMIIGRLLAGIGIGISSAIVPLYISEVAREHIFCLVNVYPFLFVVSCANTLFYLLDLTNWNSWCSWISKPTFYMCWDSCSIGSWITLSWKPYMVIIFPFFLFLVLFLCFASD